MDVIVGIRTCVLDKGLEVFDGIVIFVFNIHENGAIDKVGKVKLRILFKGMFQILDTESIPLCF